MLRDQLPDTMHEKVAGAFDIWGIEELYPPQKESMGPIANGENLVLSVPTAAGKSIVAYIAILNRFFKEKGKALYVVPLRALAAEKFKELRELSKMGLRVALSYGDYDEEDRRLERYDVVVATSEKADSLLRHRSKWLRNLKVIVADEVHLLNDRGRGPTLEVILTRFKQLNVDAQLICLSATIGNAEEIAGWLGARLITSDFRPVDLKEGVIHESEVVFPDLSRSPIEKVTGKALTDAAMDCVLNSKDGLGQSLVFVNTRRSSESSALDMSKVLSTRLTGKDLQRLRDISQALGKGDARVIRKLKKAVAGGAAFHHAGLAHDQRKIIEDGFRDRAIKVLFATPTLAAGINLPARRVIVRDWTRFESWNPRTPIPVLEIKQMFGRAGRPKFDTQGESFILARKERELDLLMERYIWGQPEEVTSKLGSKPALRTHLLSSFATNYVRDKDEMWQFIESTFYAYQNDTWKISVDVEELLDFLIDEGFLKEEEDNIEATDLGKRVARLYIDPLSAVVLKRALGSVPKKLTPFSILQAACYTPDVPPLFVRGKDHDHVTEVMYSREEELMIPIPDDRADYEFFLASVKTAIFLMEWIGENEEGLEASEERIETLFNMGPGDIRSKVETALWILYAMRELSRLFDSPLTQDIDRVSLRVENGIRDDLIPMISIKGVGRVRARRLYEAGFKNPDHIRKATLKQLASVRGIGRQLALQIQNELSGEGSEGREYVEEPEEEVKQSALFDFG